MRLFAEALRAPVLRLLVVRPDFDVVDFFAAPRLPCLEDDFFVAIWILPLTSLQLPGDSRQTSAAACGEVTNRIDKKDVPRRTVAEKRYLPKFSQTGTGVTMGILKSPCGFKTGMLLPALSFFRALSNGMAQFPVFGSTFRSIGAERFRNAIGCALRRLRASAVARASFAFPATP